MSHSAQTGSVPHQCNTVTCPCANTCTLQLNLSSGIVTTPSWAVQYKGLPSCKPLYSLQAVHSGCALVLSTHPPFPPLKSLSGFLTKAGPIGCLTKLVQPVSQAVSALVLCTVGAGPAHEEYSGAQRERGAAVHVWRREQKCWGGGRSGAKCRCAERSETHCKQTRNI